MEVDTYQTRLKTIFLEFALLNWRCSDRQLSFSCHIRGDTCCMSVAASARWEAMRAVCASGQQPQPLPFQQRPRDRHRDRWMTENYSSTGILRINISRKNTPSNREQKNKQVQQGATGRNRAGRLYLELVFLGIFSFPDLSTWILICGYCDAPMEELPFDVFLTMNCWYVKLATK